MKVSVKVKIRKVYRVSALWIHGAGYARRAAKKRFLERESI